jgi:small ligand-binding sensory domain FIST
MLANDHSQELIAYTLAESWACVKHKVDDWGYYAPAMSSTSPYSRTPDRTGAYSAASAVSSHIDTRTAAMEVSERIHDELAGRCDLLLLFCSYHHRAAFADAGRVFRQTISPRTMLGVTAEAVLGGEHELDGRAGLAAIGMRLGEARLNVFTTSPDHPIPLSDPAAVRDRIKLNAEFRTAIVLADPFTTPMARLLPALTGCGEDGQAVPIIGGMASGASQPGLNVMLLNDRVLTTGGVGVSISGAIDIDFVVSQGCRPIGKPLVVTKAHENVILELGSRRALDALQHMAENLSEAERGMLTRGLLIGTVIDEYKDRFGRGDFLIRSLLGIDQRAGGIAVGDMPRIGQTVQFHVRDAATAAEDLQLLLDAQQLKTKPFGALLFTCNGRGSRLFGKPGHDLRMIHDRLGQVPTAGFFAAGEFGPIGERSFLHGHTACLALLRAPQRID